MPVRAADLDLDLEVFTGPFDLLLTLVLRDEIDLLEVDLAEIVLSYMDHLELRGEIDLEVATEFLVLIAALLELKSRMLLPGEQEEELELDAGEAAEELFERLEIFPERCSICQDSARDEFHPIWISFQTAKETPFCGIHIPNENKEASMRTLRFHGSAI